MQYTEHPTRKSCTHLWILDSYSLGKCKKCGATKQFSKLTEGEIEDRLERERTTTQRIANDSVDSVKKVTEIEGGNNNPLDDETRRAIELLYNKLGKVNAVHVQTREIGDYFLADCKDRGLSLKTLESYILHIKRLVKLSGVFPPKAKVIQGFLATKSPYNADSHYRTWRALGNYAKRIYGIPSFMDAVTRPRIPKGIMPTLEEEHLKKLAILLKDASARDKAILCLLIDTAIRSSEASNLRFDDIRQDTIFVHGKTGYREVPISSYPRGLLLSLPAHEDGYVFHGTGKYKGYRLGKTGIYKVVRKYLRMVGHTGKQFGAQVLRRSFGRWWLLDGGDMKSLSIIYGHSSIATTDKAYTPLATGDVANLHHRHSPGGVFENELC